MSKKNDAKFLKEFDLSLLNWHDKFDEFWPLHSKVSKICTLTGSFWRKYVILELKRHRGVIFYDTEEWWKIWRKTDLWFGKWHQEFSKFSPQHSKVSKLGLWWDPFIENLGAWNYLQKSYVLWQWRMMQNLKRNWLVVSKLTWGVWRILTRAKSKKVALDGLLLTELYNVWVKKEQSSYVWWHWRLCKIWRKTNLCF